MALDDINCTHILSLNQSSRREKKKCEYSNLCNQVTNNNIVVLFYYVNLYVLLLFIIDSCAFYRFFNIKIIIHELRDVINCCNEAKLKLKLVAQESRSLYGLYYTFIFFPLSNLYTYSLN